MSPRPTIFVSAVSRELRSARQLVANTLTFLGYEPIWQDIFGTEGGDLREVLRGKIDQSKGVVQLVGQCYGTEPPAPDEQFGRVSYTQYEALYARQHGRKVWYLFMDESYPIDSHKPEPAELRELQAAYRQRVRSDAHLFHALTSSDALEAGVLKLRDDLTQLRRGVKQWAIGVAVLLVVSVGIGFWLMRGQQQTNREMHSIATEMAKFRQGLNDYPRVETELRRRGGGAEGAVDDEAVYAELGRRLGVDAKALRATLPTLAANLEQEGHASSMERANAAYFRRDFAAAERLALQAGDEAKVSAPSGRKAAIGALQLAGLASEKLTQYPRALEHFREAEKLTDRAQNPADWAEIQQSIGEVLIDEGEFGQAIGILRAAAEVRARVLGPEHAEALRSRADLALALDGNGQSAEAIEEFRVVIGLQEKTLGPDNALTLATRGNLAAALNKKGQSSEAESEYRRLRDRARVALGPEEITTLASSNNLAGVLDTEGKYAEAEKEYRELIPVEEKVLGPEHRLTLASQGGLANALDHGGEAAAAEALDRQVLRARERILGLEHPDTLTSRNNLAIAVSHQGRFGDAEREHREVLRLRENVLGPAHPDTLSSHNNLANALANQKKYGEAEREYRSLILLQERTLGPRHPDVLSACFNLALTLAREGKYREAYEFARRAAQEAAATLGPEHPSTRNYEKLRQMLEREHRN